LNKKKKKKKAAEPPKKENYAEKRARELKEANEKNSPFGGGLKKTGGPSPIGGGTSGGSTGGGPSGGASGGTGGANKFGGGLRKVEINTTVREESGARSPSPKSPVSPNPWGNKLNVPKKEEPKKEESKSPGGGLAKTTPTPAKPTPTPVVAEVKSSGPKPGETQEEMIRREAAERREQRAKQQKDDEQRKKEQTAKEVADKDQADRKKALQAKFAKLGSTGSGGK